MVDNNMKTCMIVDDSRVVRMVARKIVEGLGFDVIEAEDGLIAFGLCEKKLPDAILLDWNMPNMDGLECMKKVRQLPDGDKVKIVFCTTENDLSHIRNAIANGADEYVMKPFDAEIITGKFIQVGLIEG